MHSIEISGPRLRAMIIPPLACVLLFACSVNVKKEADGNDKQVDIKTPMGGIHVGKSADLADVGMKVYPGSKMHPSNDGADENANVNISSFGYGLKVVAQQYQSDDTPAKVIAFYKEELKKYGEVLVCHSPNHMHVDTNFKSDSDDSHKLTCNTNNGNNTELKAGTKENQHVVAVEPEGNGTKFSLVYVHIRGKEAEI